MAFEGFPRETVRFLRGLRAHNDKAWFDAHRDAYRRDFLAPAQDFIVAIEPRLRKIEPDLHAEPRVNGSILRINRDVRFSKDKSPYKDHMDLFFWTGAERKGWDTSGFFFRLTPTRLLLGAGIHSFAPPVLARYRAAVADAKRGAALARVVDAVRAAGYEVGTESYKRVPARVVGPDHPRAALFRHGGLHGGWEGAHPASLGTPAFVDFVVARFAGVAPLHRWLRKM